MPSLSLAIRFRGVPLETAYVEYVYGLLARQAVKYNRLNGLDGILLTLHGDRASAKTHRAVMGDPTPTDVITVRYDATPLAPAHAELFVNPMQAIRCAASRDPATLLREEKDIPWSAGHELALYIAHGLDHLSGADDATYEGYRTMRRRELRWLSDIPDEILSGLFVS